MSMTCPVCKATNADQSDFCGACGAELTSIVEVAATMSEPESLPTEASALENGFASFLGPTSTSPTTFRDVFAVSSSSDTVKLTCKQSNSPTPFFVLTGETLLVGRFDPDSGPVDVDLDGFAGDDTISRRHAELYCEAGQWKVKDLASTNGVFIKLSGQTRFGARITAPEPLHFGDEIAFGKVRFAFESV